MKLKVVTFLLFYPLLCICQNQQLSVIVDAETKEPIEFVDVFNAQDNTFTNADGAFFFISALDSVKAYKVGYEKLETTFQKLKDTVFLMPSTYKLSEVVLTNTKTLWDKVRDSIPKNYLFSPFKERFFLRCLLRKNGEIIRIQDIEGKLSRKTLLYRGGMDASKEDFAFEISNMRKIGIEKDENDVYFTFFSLSELLFETIRLNATGDGFTLTEKEFENENKAKVFFQSDSTLVGLNTSGHYIINESDRAIEAFVMKSERDLDNYFKNGPIRSRTIGVEHVANFTKSGKWDKYFITSSKIVYTVEITHTKKTFRDIYTSEYILKTYDNNGSFPFKENSNKKRDIFKLRHKYDPEFWQTQNRLLLTDEMNSFIKKTGDKKSQFKLRSNMKR